MYFLIYFFKVNKLKILDYAKGNKKEEGLYGLIFRYFILLVCLELLV